MYIQVPISNTHAHEHIVAGEQRLIYKYGDLVRYKFGAKARALTSFLFQFMAAFSNAVL